MPSYTIHFANAEQLNAFRAACAATDDKLMTQLLMATGLPSIYQYPVSIAVPEHLFRIAPVIPSNDEEEI